MKKHNHGGARKGAGRKSDGIERGSYLLYLAKSTYAKAKQKAIAEKRSLSRTVENAIEDYVNEDTKN